ncbi:MAG: UDP-N-acetylmuramoyl-L-alanyl-D-glutamate--2,6-diaminopimelate ligase [Candidatus Staskawiczbacteria bacterium]|nr:UDP-N-acetylmuramoyl-L-alanyl-D-glutamate--2,6-diaminopimelate ligase [Candidatus Staskawiczbacteria bacterium]
MTIKAFVTKLIPPFLLKVYHYKLALLAAILFWFPSKKLIVIGVTGTSGKSTTVDFITRILEEAGHKTASISSIRFKIGGQEWKNNLKMTMPGRFKIQSFLKKAKKSGCQYVVLEVTSQGILQYRNKFINFKTAVFTNLSREHIEAHGSFENYRAAKLKLFKATKNTHIINIDDPNFEYFLKITSEKKWKYGFRGFDFSPVGELPDSNLKTIFADNILESNNSLKFSVEDAQFHLNLLGRFNVYNALAAVCVGLSEGVSLNTCSKALSKVKGIAGRMEVVAKQPFTVIVDYAHTPEQLESVYKSLQPKPLICVLGSCGGGRDKWKRPVLGKIARDYCKEVIVTNEDPYDEDPMRIIEDVAEGTDGKAQKILDRREAIKKAIKLATPYDIVVITGKGSEPLMCLENGKKIPWDDCQIAREELMKLEPAPGAIDRLP